MIKLTKEDENQRENVNSFSLANYTIHQVFTLEELQEHIRKKKENE